MKTPWEPFADLQTAYWYQDSYIPVKRAYARGFIDGWMWESPRGEEFPRHQEPFYEQGWMDGASAKPSEPPQEQGLPKETNQS